MSIKIQENVSLIPYTTFKTGGTARFFCEVNTVEELKEALKAHKKFFILGGGSNILMGDYDGLVIKMNISNAGDNWDDFVAKCVAEGKYGLENLSYIPGTIGAAPVQNIGAYGVEVKDRIEKVHTLNADTLEERIFTKEECQFSYRNSIFKREKQWIITHVEFNFTNEINTSYKGLEGLKTPQEIRDAVIKIRKEKLPDWHILGTAGSFFKNPIVPIGSVNYPDLPKYPVDEKTEKVSLAFIIDKICGMKDFKIGNVGTYKNQALVIVNYGGATAKEVDDFAKKIESVVFEKTGLTIEREVESIV
jgi:UDP-N-acetylmuramate dehydrogenase